MDKKNHLTYLKNTTVPFFFYIKPNKRLLFMYILFPHLINTKELPLRTSPPFLSVCLSFPPYPLSFNLSLNLKILHLKKYAPPKHLAFGISPLNLSLNLIRSYSFYLITTSHFILFLLSSPLFSFHSILGISGGDWDGLETLDGI